MKRICLLGLLPAMMSLQAMAEPTAYRCTYQESTYQAAFMEAPVNRTCPPGQCYYDLQVDEAAGSGSVNGIPGYRVEGSEQKLVLRRSSINPVMGGTDTATFTLDRESLRFVGTKTTAPAVTVTSFGQCMALPGAQP